MDGTNFDHFSAGDAPAANDEVVDLTRYFLEAHQIVLGVPCPVPAERVEAEISEALRILESPAGRLRAVLTFAVEASNVRGEPVRSLRFLRRFAFGDRIGIRKQAIDSMRGGREASPPPETPMEEEDLVEGFLVHLKIEEGKARHTIRTYAESIAVFRAFIGEHRIGLRDVAREDIIRFKGYLMERGNSPQTVNARLAAVRAFYNYLVLVREIETDPTRGIRRVPEHHKKLPILTADEVQRMLNVIDTDTILGARNHLLITMLFATGARIGELVNLRLPDIDQTRWTVTFRERKNKHDLSVPLPEPSIPILKNYLANVRPDLAAMAEPETADLLFFSKKGNRISRSNISRTIRGIAKRAGIEKQVSSHTFRRSVATIMANRDMPAELIRTFLGHRSINTTLKNYIAYSDEAQRRALEEFHPLSGQLRGVSGQKPRTG